MRTIASFLLSAGLVSLAVAECPNACSSHGRCSNFDMCLCYRNWMSNDCSERVCQFGLAHVDTPKGDLDSSSGVLSGPDDLVIENNEVYPWGTTEQFPQMADSNGTVLTDTAHYYMECSNKGICDRESGLCECFPGYDGSACQRASCPSNENGMCSGHGTCESIKMMAANDYGNIYELWDKDSTMGCNCDAGYYGADCSLRRCKYGPDPLYDDDMVATRRVANWTFGFYMDKTNFNNHYDLHGNYSIHFYDVFGEDWETEFIDADDGCDEIIARLEGLPNDVIPEDSVLCLKHSVDPTELANHFLNSTQSEFNEFAIVRLFTLVFSGNVGVLKQPKIDIYLDGVRPTLVSNETTSTVVPFIFADGFHGEFEDLVPDFCEDAGTVTIEIDTSTTPHTHYLGITDVQKIKALKRCLGDANGDSSDNVEVYDWDHGNDEFPHLIKLVDSSDNHYSRICNSTDTVFPATGVAGWCDNYNPAGFYASLVFAGGKFKIYSQAGLDYVVVSAGVTSVARFNVFTTTGVLSQRGRNQGINKFYTDTMFSNVVHTIEGLDVADLSLDCEKGSLWSDPADYTDCIEKGDYVMLFNTDGVNENSFRYPNIYTVEKIGRGSHADGVTKRTSVTLNMGINIPSMNNFWFYKFTPGNKVTWVNECSDRGVCDAGTGLCKCFGGYTSDDCSQQNALAH